jgi:formiminoglutamase
MLHPSLVAREETWFQKKDPQDPRIGDRLRTLYAFSSLKAGDVVLLGLCNEVGVLANGGRAGAAEGPIAFRKAFSKLTDACLGDRGIWDAGDVPATVDYSVFFDAMQSVVSQCVSAGAIPLVIGGGHDCSFGNYLGLDALRDHAPMRPPAVINIDAHLDVRPVHGPSSGNPFFKMLEHGLAGEDLAELGLIPFVNSDAHQRYARDKGAHLHFLKPGQEQTLVQEAKAALTRFEGRGRRVLATIDMDGIGAAWAPGVSALNPWGISADMAMQLAQIFGSHPSVAVFDLMEFAPAQDRDGQTGRLLAFLAAAFCEGLKARKG